MPTEPSYSGLTMPVFAAFGWAGEETAINFALEQLEQFINDVYAVLSRDARNLFPYHGLDRTSQIAYIASEEDVESKPFIYLAARPISLETNLAIRSKEPLAKAYKACSINKSGLLKILESLGSEWHLHFQQMEFDPDTGTSTHYQDLLQEKIGDLNEELLAEKVDRAQYLNSEDKWIVPLSVFRRLNSEKVSSLGYGAVTSVADQISSLVPLVLFLSGKKLKSKSAPKKKKEILNHVEETAIRQPADSAELETFSYVSHMQPLHIRRGFINLTPKHWPYFAINARTETRPVELKYGDSKDSDCAVWRLSDNNMARLVLSSKVQDWIEEHFEEHDSIQVIAEKSKDNQIEITLMPVE